MLGFDRARHFLVQRPVQWVDSPFPFLLVSDCGKMSQEALDPSTSPARKSRQQEKEELAYLNDRFASYIEQVRSLKEANLRYEFELQTVKEQLGSESEEIKKLFEAELTDARTLIDETAKEKARQQLIATKNAQRVKELEAE